ncbi:MAG: ABC transporter permease, partial [Bacteroidota bacterium]
MYKFQWLLRMAWRDSRRSRGRLALFTFAIVLGVAALVAIDSFDYNLRRDIESEAKALLGADLSVRSNQAFPDSVRAILDSVGGTQSNEASFGTMAYFPKTEDNRFVQVRALSGGFPFYGKLETIPTAAAESFRAGRRALLDQNLMLQFQVAVGDSVRIGKIKFEVVGKLLSIPGQNGFSSTTSTPIFIPLQDLDSTGLIQLGSRIQYQRYYKLDQAAEEIDAWADSNRSRLGNMRLRVTTVNSRQENLQEAFGNMTDFLNLVGFIALLLGCVGVASAVEVYMRDKVNSVAVLRCLGAKGQDAFLIFLIQVGLMGLAGSILGSLLGSAL